MQSLNRRRIKSASCLGMAVPRLDFFLWQNSTCTHPGRRNALMSLSTPAHCQTPTHHLLTLWNPSYAADAMDEHLSVLLDWAGRWGRGSLASRRPLKHSPVWEPQWVGEGVPGVLCSPEPEGEIGELLQFRIEPPVGEGDADPDLGEEAFGSPHGRRKIGVPGDEHQCLAGSEEEKLHREDTDGDISLLLLMPADRSTAVGTGRLLSLEGCDVHGHSCAFERSQVGAVLTDRKRVVAVHVKGDGSEVVDGLDVGPLVKNAQIAPQEAPQVQPSRVSFAQGPRGLAGGEVEVEAVHEKDHSVGQRVFPAKKNPTGRDPWGPAEAFPAARGGMYEYSSTTGLESRPERHALRPEASRFSRMWDAFMTDRGLWWPFESPARRMTERNGHLNRPMGHLAPPQDPIAPFPWMRAAS